MLWRNKWLLVLAALIGAYVYYNPPSRIGIARSGFVVYNRIPVPLMNIVVDNKGNLAPYSDLTARDPQFRICRIIKDLENQRTLSSAYLVIGTGFLGHKTFTRDSIQGCDARFRGVTPVELPSEKAVKRYNELLDKGATVALILKVRAN